jgi:hypothetical protein
MIIKADEENTLIIIDKQAYNGKIEEFFISNDFQNAAQTFYGERFNFKKLGELQIREQYQIKISNRFTTLENLNVSEDIDRAWENIKESIKISAKESLGLYERKQHKL